jgi:IclR family transcriptional regulator, acetate operon repressor
MVFDLKPNATPKKDPDQSEKKSLGKSSQVQSLTRALTILTKLSQNDGGLILTELANLCALPTSTTHRLLTTLENDRFVRFDRTTNLWSVGVQSFVVGNAFARSRNFVPLAKTFMRHLMEEAGETVNLAAQDQDEIVYLAQVESREIMRASVRPGSRVPLHCSAVGKAILAGMNDIDRNLIIQLKSDTPDENHIFTPEFLKSLKDTQLLGYALDDEEQAIGMRCVASIVYDENSGPLAAISISGPTARITKARIPTLGRLVQKTCKDITAEFGGRLPLDINRPLHATGTKNASSLNNALQLIAGGTKKK